MNSIGLGHCRGRDTFGHLRGYNLSVRQVSDRSVRNKFIDIFEIGKIVSEVANCQITEEIVFKWLQNPSDTSSDSSSDTSKNDEKKAKNQPQNQASDTSDTFFANLRGVDASQIKIGSNVFKRTEPTYLPCSICQTTQDPCLFTINNNPICGQCFESVSSKASH